MNSGDKSESNIGCMRIRLDAIYPFCGLLPALQDEKILKRTADRILNLDRSKWVAKKDGDGPIWICGENLEVKLRNLIQTELNITESLNDPKVRNKHLAYVFIFYILNKQLPGNNARKVIDNIVNPVNSCAMFRFPSAYWYYPELCSALFEQVYLLSEGEPAAIDVFITTVFSLVPFENGSHMLMYMLLGYLSLERMEYLMLSSRDDRGRTFLFYSHHGSGVVHRQNILQQYKIKDQLLKLFELLMVQDNNGQTALHVNTVEIIDFLQRLYIPRYRQQTLDLLQHEDKERRTASDIADKVDREKLDWLFNQVENNCYPLLGQDALLSTLLQMNPVVVIFYNTINRKESTEEAMEIAEAFKSLSYDVLLKKNMTKKEMKGQIDRCARFGKEEHHGEPPSALIVVVLSHGSLGSIQLSNGEEIEEMKLAEIEEAMCCLDDGRPKLLITQCCQLSEEKRQMNPKSYSPTHSDFCAMMSCVPGQTSTRGLFIRILAKHIRTAEVNQPIHSIFSKVAADMAQQITIKGKMKSQTPIILKTYKANLCLANIRKKSLPSPQPATVTERQAPIQSDQNDNMTHIDIEEQLLTASTLDRDLLTTKGSSEMLDAFYEAAENSNPLPHPEQTEEEPVAPRYAVNAPDLYIPLMGFVTYVLVSAVALGTQGSFTPESIGMLMSSAIGWLLLEVCLILFILYILMVATSMGYLEWTAYCGYKYTGMVIALMCGIFINKLAYYISLAYTGLALAFFVTRSLKVQILPHSEDSMNGGNKRRLYVLLALAGIQPLFMWWLTFSPVK